MCPARHLMSAAHLCCQRRLQARPGVAIGAQRRGRDDYVELDDDYVQSNEGFNLVLASQRSVSHQTNNISSGLIPFLSLNRMVFCAGFPASHKWQSAENTTDTDRPLCGYNLWPLPCWDFQISSGLLLTKAFTRRIICAPSWMNGCAHQWE